MNRLRAHTGLLAIAALSALAASGTAWSRPIQYGAIDDPDLVECDRLHWRGRVEESTPCYRRVLASASADAVRAEAAWALQDLHTANRLFQSALDANPADTAVLARWGDLYAATHQDAEAMDIYRQALQADATNALAMLGAARLLVGGFDEAANTYLEPLLTNATLHEGARAGAWLLLARMALENRDLDEARHALDSAEALIDRNAWPPLEVYALRASVDLVNGVSPSPWTDASLEYNRHYGNIYAVPAHFHVIARRYRDAIDLYQKAVDTEPGLAAAHEELGVNLLRDNQVSRARRHLEIAHDEDPFSPVAVNTLRLLDSFSNFTLVRDPELPEGKDEVPIVLRLHKDEAAAIAPYALDLTRRSIEEFRTRYRFDLSEPVIIEMYPDHEDFAVRTAGMPGIGILGATFGYVVAMDSPSARSTDHFQWGTTLWHEMAHVFTLEASNHLVPRWFSEGVSVFEEWRSGPNPGVHIPLPVYEAMRDDRFLPISVLDQGFMRPSYPDQVIVSYMQAGLACQFIDAHFGADKLAAMLAKYAEGLDTPQAIKAVLGITAPKFDREFRNFVDAEHGAVVAALDDWHATAGVMASRYGDGDWAGAIEAAQRMIGIHPGYIEPDSPYLVLARASNETGLRDEAIAAMERFRANGGYDPDALKTYAEWLVDAGRPGQAAGVLQTVALVQPLDQELHGTLGDLLLETGNAGAALREYEIALAQDPHDKATAHYRVAEAHRAIGNVDQSRDSLLLALDIAPNFRPAQRLLLELMRTPPAQNTDNHETDRSE